MQLLQLCRLPSVRTLEERDLVDAIFLQKLAKLSLVCAFSELCLWHALSFLLPGRVNQPPG